MKIAIFTEVAEPHVCGISSYVEVLRRGLEELGHRVIIVTSSTHTKKTFYKDRVIRCAAKKCKNKYGHQCKTIQDKYVIKFLTRYKPDIIHIHTDTKIGYMGLEMADRLRCPVVFSVHDYFMDRFAAENSKLVWRIKTMVEKKHFCDMIDNAHLITSSNKRASYFVRAADRKRKVWLIPSAADRSVFDYRLVNQTAIEKMRENLGLPPDAVTAVFAGELSVDKNLEFVLKAFAKYLKKSDRLHFIIVGEGTELSHLKNMCVRLKLSDKVHFTGQIAHSIMPAVFAACDIYVCSSDDGLMSMSFVEAMSCGLPVLVKEDKEKLVYNMIKDGGNGFVYSDEKSFAEYLKKLTRFTPAERDKLRRAVRASMRDKDSVNMAGCMIKAYEQAIKAFRVNVNFLK